VNFLRADTRIVFTLIKMQVEVSSLVYCDGTYWAVDRRVQVFKDFFVKFFVVQVVFLKRK